MITQAEDNSWSELLTAELVVKAAQIDRHNGSLKFSCHVSNPAQNHQTWRVIVNCQRCARDAPRLLRPRTARTNSSPAGRKSEGESMEPVIAPLRRWLAFIRDFVGQLVAILRPQDIPPLSMIPFFGFISTSRT